ncbi:MAG: DUF1697 domain-containing protein [Actinomycetota bacterium]
MKEKRYLALLRGINVGGKNIIKMAELKACFEAIGLTDVATFIQSGNVLFTGRDDKSQTTAKIEKTLSRRFKYNSRVVVVSYNELRGVGTHAPKGFGDNPATFRYDVVFLKDPLTAQTAIKSISTKDGVDAAFPGRGVIYFSRLAERASQSHLSRVVQLPIYQHMTIRNWNTTTKLIALMEAGKER